ncbi:sulfurtransferase [Natronosporangium hydrolyticum]|uniref:sulfurtransferase n=1 Tax=Natronosporangium hydrolyticum TaxID=2811111 RepID=UPI001EFA06B8|nr:sulfurtransferase [Natronosporangium hydrolyticum]
MADPLLDPARLAALVTGASPPTLLDVRWRLASPAAGAEEYAAGHLPGAVFLDLDTQLCGPPGRGGRHPLPDPHRLEAVLRAAGVRDGASVVVYDAGGDEPGRQSAARAWWTLRWAGLTEVSVLDGGYAGWVAAGHPTSTGTPVPEVGDVRVRPGGLPTLDADQAAALAARGRLLDVRAAARYRGESEPVDPVAGHIPGAVNLPASPQLLGGASAPAEIRAAVGEVLADPDPAQPLGVYCGSGVSAAHTLLALHRAGFSQAALYVGSWSHWITDPDRPVAKGEEAAA